VLEVVLEAILYIPIYKTILFTARGLSAMPLSICVTNSRLTWIYLDIGIELQPMHLPTKILGFMWQQDQYLIHLELFAAYYAIFCRWTASNVLRKDIPAAALTSLKISNRVEPSRYDLALTCSYPCGGAEYLEDSLELNNELLTIQISMRICPPEK
jgi:hypothetical protein